MKTVKREKLSNLLMVCGNEEKYDIVILDKTVKEWVGIGWVDVRTATEEDYDKYPVVVA